MNLAGLKRNEKGRTKKILISYSKYLTLLNKILRKGNYLYGKNKYIRDMKNGFYYRPKTLEDEVIHFIYCYIDYDNGNKFLRTISAYHVAAKNCQTFRIISNEPTGDTETFDKLYDFIERKTKPYSKK
ncbi:hypothetical protein [Liquorilactobacillus oeni]|uniref:Uncharacterized protein n=1 Tax=Liquorilactobacillus oeni DSM 19972 TaxID=1423777 RepID=A0A0R1M7H9_9LACO|nr:hypothetical protein [Liquorilactobacillus oeni]KRL04128.1 hypothetical protein FD46_GL001244 [Liquorilactobacillus oeni DSM 19972]